ncbi:MAG: 1-acyl-sn-glycerol-3-phosphate acyltransferase [Candidatus Omnitrophica bacterium]|nr:1-acyl-sn-glycerol-3-phosphate acyltransferase [Candidatus Omnitrophota bacterium]
MFNKIFYWISIFVLHVARWLHFPLKVYGRENVPAKGPFIIAGNHLSNLDPVLIPISCPRRLNFVAKEELFNNKIFGWVLLTLGAFPVRRGQTDLGAIRVFLDRLKTEPVLIFPEGTRMSEGKELKIQEGVGLLVKKTHLPVVPVCVEGTDIVMPRGAKTMKRHPVTLTFGKPISFDPGLSREEIAYAVLQKIYELKK